ncbi:hypothetical protein I79_006008 [Cricetulus griseus]|nr:hypothetical protein I79_006008 [Cricetulus griseus]
MEQRVISVYSSTSQSTIKGSQGRNLEAGADAEAVEDAAYRIPPHSFLSLISYSIQDHQPRDGTTHNGQSPSKLIINLENAPTDLLTG